MKDRWEYRVVRLVRPDDDAELNALGRDGWELVSVAPSGENGFVAYLKRERRR